MNSRNLIILLISYFIYGCSDYPSGHKDGYGGIESRQWIVFGKAEYLEGFETGKAEKFQQDWLAENFSDINQRQCPIVTILPDPLMFLPIEYKRVAFDTYQMNVQ